MKALLSIKPEFASKIFEGEKKFEFRRSIFKKPVKCVIVYASSPVCKVIGEFEVEELISDDLENLWRKTKKHAGISKDYFYSYFSDKEKGHAIKIGNIKKYRTPLPLKETFGVLPPQSYLYLI
jgi:predicted transcriptional regulator